MCYRIGWRNRVARSKEGFLFRNVPFKSSDFPHCKSIKVTPMPKEKRHHCNNCNTSFSVTVGTIFHHTRLPLQKWFLAISIILNTKKELSARQPGRDLNVNKGTAWRMTMKIRQAVTQNAQRDC